MLIEPTNNPLGVALVKGIWEPHEVKKKSFDLGGNRTHDLRIRSTVTLPNYLRGLTEKVGDDLGGKFPYLVWFPHLSCVFQTLGVFMGP